MTYVLGKLSDESCFGHKHSKSDNDLLKEVPCLKPKPKEAKLKNNRNNSRTF